MAEDKLSFNEFSRQCRFHILIPTKDGHRAICAKNKRGKCNSYSCPRRR